MEDLVSMKSQVDRIIDNIRLYIQKALRAKENCLLSQICPKVNDTFNFRGTLSLVNLEIMQC